MGCRTCGELEPYWFYTLALYCYSKHIPQIEVVLTVFSTQIERVFLTARTINFVQNALSPLWCQIRGLHLHYENWILGIITIIITCITVVHQSWSIQAVLYCAILKSSLQFLVLHPWGIVLPMQHGFLLWLSNTKHSLSITLKTNAIQIFREQVLIHILSSVPSAIPLWQLFLCMDVFWGYCTNLTGLQPFVWQCTCIVSVFSVTNSEGLSEIVERRTDHHSFWKHNTAIYFFSFLYQKSHLCTLTGN